MSDARVRVAMGEIKVLDRSGVLSVIGLGSCVAVILIDPTGPIAGLAHVLLPEAAAGRSGAPIGRYADTAVPRLLERLESAGADTGRLQAKVVGGASMFGPISSGNDRKSLGSRNVEAVRELLKRYDIALCAEEIGGRAGRSVDVDVVSGNVTVSSVRQDDVIL